jgi:hypothetical protein
MSELKQLRQALINGNLSTGYGLQEGRRGRAAAALLDNGSLDSLIINKQREIVRLVAESNESPNKNNYDNYSKLIEEKQGELNELVKGKSLRELRGSLLLSL